MILYMYYNSLILIYVLYKSKTFELLELLDIVGFIVGMFYGYCLWAQVVVLLMLLLHWTVRDRFYAGFVFG